MSSQIVKRDLVQAVDVLGAGYGNFSRKTEIHRHSEIVFPVWHMDHQFVILKAGNGDVKEISCPHDYPCQCRHSDGMLPVPLPAVLGTISCFQRYDVERN